jgi:PAS domain S-box-containing protein
MAGENPAQMQRTLDGRSKDEVRRASVEANAKFRTMFEQGQQFASLLTPDGRLIEVNRLVLDVGGFPREELVDKPFWECGWWLPSPELCARIKQACEQAVGGTVYHAENPYYTADGQQRWVSMSISPVLDQNGEVIFLNPTGFDITERVEAQRALVLSQEREQQQRRLYEAILGNTPDLAYVFDLQYRFIYANAGLLAMWGKTWEECAGKTCLELGYEPWHAEMHSREIDQVVATRKPIRGKVPFNGTFGRRIYDYIFVPVINDAAVEAVAGTTRDVTDLDEIALELRMLADELAETDRRKTEFLAMLAHELRNPLAPLRNAVHIIRNAHGRQDLLETAGAIMQRQLAQMVRLVDDLLDISRVSQGKISLKKESVDLASVVQQAIETCRPTLERAQQSLQVELPTGPVFLEADAVRLSQVFANLINNASKYGDPGMPITLRATLEGSQVAISVKDHGIGIAPEVLPRVFDMFMQAHRETEHSRGGLGIGLALVKTLVEMHGGNVQGLSDGLGHGAEFIVRLPVTATAQTPAAPLGAAPATIAGRRILVVDDNQDAAQSLAQLLQVMGNVTHTVHDGLAAVQAATEFAPELILLDIGLPGIDGHEVCRRVLRQRKAEERPPIIVAVSGWGTAEDRAMSGAAGFSAHLVKPVDLKMLVDTLNTLLAVQAQSDNST